MNNISPHGICLAVFSKLYWNISSLDSNCTLCWQKMEYVSRGLRMSSYNNAISSSLNLLAASVSRESCWINLSFSNVGHGVLVRRAHRCAIFHFMPIASLLPWDPCLLVLVDSISDTEEHLGFLCCLEILAAPGSIAEEALRFFCLCISEKIADQFVWNFAISIVTLMARSSRSLLELRNFCGVEPSTALQMSQAIRYYINFDVSSVYSSKLGNWFCYARKMKGFLDVLMWEVFTFS